MSKETYNYNEAYAACVEYFNGSEIAASVFLDKYALRNNDGEILEKTPDQMHRRIAKEFARIERKKFKNPISEDEIFNLLDRFSCIIPQGSPMYGIGNENQLVSLSNCFVIPSTVDSYGGICKYDEQLVQISKRRGGVGGDVANLRPEGSRTKNAARTSTGKITFMSRFSNSIREVGQNGRRGAKMITTSIHHPEAVKVWDTEERGEPYEVEVKGHKDYGSFKISSKHYDPENLDFATCKYDSSKVTGANISIRLTDEFLTALDNNEKFQQRWPVDKEEFEQRKSEGKYVSEKWVDAKSAWEKVIYGAWRTAEPGVLFWDNILKESPADCYSKFGFRTLSTNPCGEIPLSAYDSCRLMVLNLFHFVKNPWTKDAYFDFEDFFEKSKILQRLMDNLIDLEIESIEAIIEKIKNDPEEEDIKRREIDLWTNVLEVCKKGRRTGCGITALGDTVAALNFKYGSEDSIDLVDSIYKTLKFGCYTSSIDMSEELGSFPVWDHELEKDNPFINRIKDEVIHLGEKVIYGKDLWEKMKRVGRRNIALLTTAPTGSISLLAKLLFYFGTSSGIEPQYTDEPYTRKKKGNPGDENFRVDSVDQNGDSWMHFQIYSPAIKDWMELTGETDWKKSPFKNCTAIDLDWKQRVKLQATAQRHIDHSISSTVNLPNDVTVEKVMEIYETAAKLGCKGITVYRDGCRTGVLVKDSEKGNEDKISKTSAPKRPNALSCEVHHTTIKGHRYYVVIGLFKGEPYEVFVNSNHDNEGEIVIPKSIQSGIITKEKRGKYVLEVDDKSYVLTNGHSDPNADTIARLASTGLRHGVDISFIVHQLEKTKGGDMHSFSKVLARVLKKYIEDGTKVYGENCPDCNSDSCSIERMEGCIICKNCGWTKCT